MFELYWFSESFAAIKSNPLRSFLSILGVVFGVASVIAMLGVGLGASKQIDALIGSLGSQTIHILSKDLAPGEWSKVIASTRGLSERDVYLVKDMVTDADVSPIIKWDVGDVNQENSDPRIALYGLSPNFIKIIKSHMAAGRFFTAFENDKAMPVVILGADLARKWYKGPLSDVINKDVRIERVWCKIIGVIEFSKGSPDNYERAGTPQGQGSAGAEIKDLGLGNAILIPSESGMKRFGKPPTPNLYHQIIVKLNEGSDPLVTKTSLKNTLAKLHRNASVFDTIAAEEVIEQRKKSAQLFSSFLLITALISLLVGGIGIANVMLASVVEKIKEVGLRRAIGAKKRNIMIQFLSESLIICALGGVIGGILGGIVCYVVKFNTGLEVVFPWWGLLVALFISNIVGLLSGLYPAILASRISPIEALQGRA